MFGANEGLEKGGSWDDGGEKAEEGGDKGAKAEAGEEGLEGVVSFMEGNPRLDPLDPWDGDCSLQVPMLFTKGLIVGF